MSSDFQKIRNQVMWDRLIAVVEEQARTMMRVAFSTVVREAGDLSAGVFNPSGQLLAQAVLPLTRREFEVLAYFARNAGKILLHRQVLQAIWGGQYGEEADYVWTFAQRIRRKIEPDRAHPRYLLTEPGVGYHMPLPQKPTDG